LNIFQYYLLLFHLNSFIFCLISFLWLTMLASITLFLSSSSPILKVLLFSLVSTLLLAMILSNKLRVYSEPWFFRNTYFTLFLFYVSRSLSSKSCLSWIYKKVYWAFQYKYQVQLVIRFSDWDYSQNSLSQSKALILDFQEKGHFILTFPPACLQFRQLFHDDLIH
jgi:hypothetical protein